MSLFNRFRAKSVAALGLFIISLSLGLLLRAVPANAASGQLYISPSSQTIVQGAIIDMTVHEDSSTDTINAVQLKLNYPANLLKFLGVNYGSSAFDIKATETHGGGTLIIGLGQSGSPLSGDQIFADIKFEAIGIGLANLSYGCDLGTSVPSSCPDGNAIERSTDNTNILTTKTGASVTINPSGFFTGNNNAATSNYILVRRGTSVYAKDSLNSNWVTEATGLTAPIQIFAAGDRIALLDGSSNLYVKQGLSSTWVNEAGSVDDAALSF